MIGFITNQCVYNSPFFDPPRKRIPDTETIIGVKIYYGSERPDYTWDQLIALLIQVFSDIHDLLSVCVDEWNRHYDEAITSPDKE